MIAKLGAHTSEGVTLRRRVHLILDGGHGGGFLGNVVEGTLITLIIANVVAYSLQSVPWLEQRYWRQFEGFEIVSVAIFSVEYALRLWAAPEDPLVPRGGPFLSRLRYALKPLMAIDFLAIAPAILTFFMPFIDLRALRLFRLLRLLKVARYSPALLTLAQVVREERRALFGTLLLLLCAMVFAAAAMHAAEGAVQPKVFGTIPSAMWWAISTLTTVGYGDAVPITLMGRIVAGITMIIGLGLFALPVGIVATGFVSTIHRRDFIVTFGMLARVPLFHGFDPAVLGEIMNLLRAQFVPPGTVISARGEAAEAMYFVVSGEVDVELSRGNLRFHSGEFFGELALLHKTMRHATVVTVTQARLLMLSTDDFMHLMQKHPALEKKLKDTTAQTLKAIAEADEIADAEIRESQ
jgi:voltage-gated potassium channel